MAVSSLPGAPDKDLVNQIKRLEELFTIDTATLKKITHHFVDELTRGLSVEGGSIPMNPTWVMSEPTGHETGEYLALDFGGTNLRVCQVTLKERNFDIIQSKWRIREELKTGVAEELWDFLADCLHQFIETHHGPITNNTTDKIPLGFTFSYPATQNYIDEGTLQWWTKGFDIAGVEGHNVVPMFEAALRQRGVPVKLIALVNDTTGTLIASAYANLHMKIGCIFGTGCNAAYIEDCGSIPKLAHLNLPSNTPMVINCEWGAFNHRTLPRTPYDTSIDKASPRPGQQAFEKMVAGLYLGEIFRLIMVDLHSNPETHVFAGQDMSKLQNPYSLDSSFLAAIEEDPTDNLSNTLELFQTQLNISPNLPELQLIRRTAELIGTRAARLSACGVAAISIKKGYASCHVGADGSVFQKYPHFKARGAQALREILDWPAKQDPGEEDPIEILPAEDGSGVGAALIAALTLRRVQEGNMHGILHPERFS